MIVYQKTLVLTFITNQEHFRLVLFQYVYIYRLGWIFQRKQERFLASKRSGIPFVPVSAGIPLDYLLFGTNPNFCNGINIPKISFCFKNSGLESISFTYEHTNYLYTSKHNSIFVFYVEIRFTLLKLYTYIHTFKVSRNLMIKCVNI